MSGGTSKRVFNDAAAKADLTPASLLKTLLTIMEESID